MSMLLTTGDRRAEAITDPARFGPWRPVQCLSRGAASEVHLARHSVDGSLAAVKAFRASAEADEDLVRRAREIRLLAEVHHPRVVRIVDSRIGAVWPERDYIATEYVAGGDLSGLVRAAPLSFESTRMLGQAIGEALACLHQLGIIHRDVKPANIFVPIKGHREPDFAAAKLGDLGIAIEVDATRLTSNGLAVGTANYLSPEQVSGAAITPASDIYSLGLVLLECLSGARAYGGAGLEAAIARLHRAPDIPADAPRPLRRLLRDMLAMAPDQRPSAATVAARLSALRLSPQPRWIAAEAPTQRERTGVALAGAPQRRGPRFAAILGAVAAAGAIGLMWSAPAGDPAGAPGERSDPQTVSTQPPAQPAADDHAAPPAQQNSPVIAVAGLEGAGRGDEQDSAPAAPDRPGASTEPSGAPGQPTGSHTQPTSAPPTGSAAVASATSGQSTGQTAGASGATSASTDASGSTVDPVPSASDTAGPAPSAGSGSETKTPPGQVKKHAN